MLIQLEIDDRYSDFFLKLMQKLKSNIIEKITILESISIEKKSFHSLSDDEKWDIYGSIDTEEEIAVASQHKYMFEQLEKEYGNEMYNLWQK